MTEHPDPTALKEKLAQWREQTGGSVPLPLLLAENLLARANNEREAVARVLYRKVDACLSQRPSEEPDQQEQGSDTPPTESSSPLAPLLATLRSGRAEPQTAPLSKLDLQLQEQNAKLLGENEIATEKAEEDNVTGLRAANHFQQSQLRNAKHRKVRIALEQRPENPGPLNPHMLAVKILNEIQAVSPAYLERLVSYMDTLNVLQHNREMKKKKAGRTSKGSARK